MLFVIFTYFEVVVDVLSPTPNKDVCSVLFCSVLREYPLPAPGGYGDENDVSNVEPGRHTPGTEQADLTGTFAGKSIKIALSVTFPLGFSQASDREEKMAA